MVINNHSVTFILFGDTLFILNSKHEIFDFKATLQIDSMNTWIHVIWSKQSNKFIWTKICPIHSNNITFFPRLYVTTCQLSIMASYIFPLPTFILNRLLLDLQILSFFKSTVQSTRIMDFNHQLFHLHKRNDLKLVTLLFLNVFENCISSYFVSFSIFWYERTAVLSCHYQELVDTLTPWKAFPSILVHQTVSEMGFGV